jgi:hypothetical protein
MCPSLQVTGTLKDSHAVMGPEELHQLYLDGGVPRRPEPHRARRSPRKVGAFRTQWGLVPRIARFLGWRGLAPIIV